MIAWTINQFRMALCRHGFEKQETMVRDDGHTLPIGKIILYSCPRCGYTRQQKVKW